MPAKGNLRKNITVLLASGKVGIILASKTYGNRLTTIDPEDLIGLENYRWYLTKQGNVFYALANVSNGGKRTSIKMHRLLLVAPKIDHIDGDGLNNSRSNLRKCSQSDNACNSRRRSDNRSGFKGVGWQRYVGKWEANIKRSGKRYWLGLFDSEIDAAMAYDAAALKIHGEFARVNFPEKAA